MIVSLVARTGEERERALSDEAGRFVLTPPEAGEEEPLKVVYIDRQPQQAVGQVNLLLQQQDDLVYLAQEFLTTSGAAPVR